MPQTITITNKQLDRHKYLLKQAINKIKEIEDIHVMFSNTDPKYCEERKGELTKEYLEIVKQIR